MSTKLYVGNLSYATTANELQELFAKAGAVTSVELIIDRETGRSKGFAFVEMGSQAEAEQAIKMFNGTSLGNREIKVNIARPREERPRGGSGGYDRPRGGSGGFDRRGGPGGNRDRDRRSGGGGQRRY